MKYVSDKRLKEILKARPPNDECGMYLDRLLKLLIDRECKELNPWIPIDENTPKDRELIIYYAGDVDITAFQQIDYLEESDSWLNPTHYQELPGPPQE